MNYLNTKTFLSQLLLAVQETEESKITCNKFSLQNLIVLIEQSILSSPETHPVKKKGKRHFILGKEVVIDKKIDNYVYIVHPKGLILSYEDF